MNSLKIGSDSLKKRMFILGASLFTGIIGSVLIHRKKTEVKKQVFIGNWMYYDKHKRPIKLTVTKDLQVHIQDKLEADTVLYQSDNRLAFIDSMGYEISFEKKEDHFSFYDETEDTSFSLTRI